MKIPNLEERFENARSVLEKMASGDLDVFIEVEHFADPLGTLEVGINNLITDLRETFASNEEKTERLRQQRRDLETKLETIERQGQVIRKLSTPILEIWEGILVLPIIGEVDSARFGVIMETLLTRIRELRGDWVIVDVTGVDAMDAHVADYLGKLARAASLLGTQAVLTGIRASVAQSLAATRPDLGEVRTCGNLKEGLRLCLAQMGEDRTVPEGVEA